MVRHCKPPVLDGHDAGPSLGDLGEDRLGKVEVRLRGVAPPTVVVGERIVGRAEIGGRHHSGARQTAAAARAPDLKARTAAPAIVEQRGAQRRRVGPVPRAVQVSVAARSSCAIITKMNISIQ